MGLPQKNINAVALSVREATKRFGGLTAVDRFTLELPLGGLYGLIGPNGAGKTTAFNLMTGVYPLTSGEIYVAGTHIQGLRVDEIARLGICRTFQNSRLFKDMSCLDNLKVAGHRLVPYHSWEPLLFTRRYRDQESHIHTKALELLKILELETFAEQDAGSLPYGAQRRLEICRALMTGAKTILLDEPAAGMNHQETEELGEWVIKLRKQFDLSILLIEHDMKFVMGLCEKVYVLDHGCLIAEGSPRQIQTNPKVVEAYLGTEHLV